MADPVLCVRGLSKRFGALAATQDVDLDLMPGEIHALIGPNGAGKSTFVKQVAGEIASDAGSVRFLGRDVTGLSAHRRARLGLARTFQVSCLAPKLTALENVMLALAGRFGAFRFFRSALSDPALTGPAASALERVGLQSRIHLRAAELSHGERRQLEIAIALALEPKAFLLDEPMAGMGPEGSRNLTAFLSQLRSTAPILLIEHDMDAVFALADRISVLVGGRLIASGTVAEIRADPAVRHAYLGEDAA
jgi:branched-chain amino acid transport system ATP-binding protein